jgi:hypothetical protein
MSSVYPATGAAAITSHKPTSRYQSGQLPRSPFLDTYLVSDTLLRVSHSRGFTGHGSSQADPDRTPAAPRNIPSTWVFLLPGTAQASLRRLRPVLPDFDALFAAARTWDTLTSVIVAAAVGANGSASLRKTECQGILLRGEVLFIEVDAKALNPVKTTSIHNAARMVESWATNPIRGGPARKPT